MLRPSRELDREQLEQQLLAGEYQELLDSLQREEPVLQVLATWADVIAFARVTSSTDPRLDSMLRAVLRRYAESRDSRCLAVLTALLWRQLDAITRWKAHWDDDPDDLWQNVVATFFRVVSRLNLDRRPARLAQKLRNDVIHDVYVGYARRWARGRRELAVAPDEIENLADARTPGLDDILDARASCEREMQRLRAHRADGRITDPEFFLLLGTRIYGEPLAAYARRAGVKVETVKKRRQRLEARLRRLDEAAK